MILENGFVINPEQFFRPAIRISPFNTSYIKTNKNIAEDVRSTKKELLSKYFGDNYVVTVSGKAAISLALQNYNLQKDDNVLIITTTGNKYISSCVTKTIEQFCSWTRAYNEKTKLIFVNHEFGFPFTNWQQLKDYNLPIVEDRAYSLFSTDNKTTGLTGDFVIYSLPKWFPMQMGGILQSNSDVPLTDERQTETQQVLLNLLNYHLSEKNQLIEKRRQNYECFTKLFKEINCPPFFTQTEQVTPGVFMFRNNAEMNLPALKEFMQSNGIEASIFYGENAFYLPVHQNLNNDQLEFMFTLVKYFINHSAAQNNHG